MRLPVPTPVAALGPGEVGYLIAGIKDVGEARVGETVTDRGAARPTRSPGYRDPKPMVFCGLYPGRRRRVRRPARGAREAAPQRLVVHLRARDVGRARLRVPVRVPRAAAHGDRARAARARVRPRRSSPPRPTSSTASSSSTARVEVVDNPSAMPPPNEIDVDRGAVRQRHRAHADRVRRARSWSCASSGGAR